MVHSAMLLSVCHGNCDKEDGFIGGDINIQTKLGIVGEDSHGLDSIEWNGLFGSVCKIGGENVITCETR